MTSKLSMITLGVADLQASVEFYASGFGLQRAPFDSANIAFFDLEGLQLALYPRAALADDAGVSPEGQGFTGITLAQTLSTPAAVRRVIDRAVAAGATLVKPAQAVFWGGYSGYIADPDGHLWEIACEVADEPQEESADPDQL